MVYSRLQDSVVGVVEYQLRKIIRTEPPADLFEVPTDYTILTGPWGCWMGDNPYAPHFGRPGICEAQ